jgi:hypothetical protein
MNYTLHSMHWEGDHPMSTPLKIVASLNTLELMKAVADDFQIHSNRAGRAEAYQVREGGHRLVYWTSCKPNTYWDQQS